MDKFTIGQLANETGVKAEIIRYYEKRGLIPNPPRRKSGYRIFSRSHLNKILFIKQTKELGFTLNEIIKLANMIEKVVSENDIHIFVESKIQEFDLHIKKLNKEKRLLQNLLRNCSKKRNISNCPLMKFSIHD